MRSTLERADGTVSTGLGKHAMQAGKSMSPEYGERNSRTVEAEFPLFNQIPRAMPQTRLYWERDATRNMRRLFGAGVTVCTLCGSTVPEDNDCPFCGRYVKEGKIFLGEGG